MALITADDKAFDQRTGQPIHQSVEYKDEESECQQQQQVAQYGVNCNGTTLIK